MLKAELYAVLNKYPELQIDVDKELVDEIDVGPEEVAHATGRGHTISHRLVNRNGDLEVMVNFLPRALKGAK